MNMWRVVIGLVWLGLGVLARADEVSLCAEVRIEISQELTLERQAFEATMRPVYFVYINSNSLDTFRLEQMNIDIQFQDDLGNPVVATSNRADTSAAFFIRLDDSRAISSLQKYIAHDLAPEVPERGEGRC